MKWGEDKLPAYTSSLMGKTTRLTWNARAQPGADRTKLQLDSSVAEALAWQWSEQQPAVRRGADQKLVARASTSMNWGGKLTPGLDGVRLLVLTLLCWGSTVANGERAQWERLAVDMAEVLEILAKKAGHWVEVASDGKRSGRER